jgi:hypothetical protein
MTARRRDRFPGYVRRVIAASMAAKRMGVLRPGEVRIVTVRHDPDCPRPAGGPCICSPDIEFGETLGGLGDS